MTKDRLYVIPSALGSYFGVGFNTPEYQFKIDKGELEAEFDNASKNRMKLGELLEQSVLDFFEEKFNVLITDRNAKEIWAYNDQIKCKIDGMMTYNDVKTVVECKVSNSNTYTFTESLNYILQVQAYMFVTDTKQALLCGLHKGEPIFKWIQRDESIIEDIKRMVDFVCGALYGFWDFDEKYPTDLMEKYAHTTVLPVIDKLDESMIDKAKLLMVYKKQAKELDKQISDIENEFKDKFDSGRYSGNLFNISIGNYIRKGSFDLNKFKLDYPDIDYSKYNGEDTSYKRMIFTIKK